MPANPNSRKVSSLLQKPGKLSGQDKQAVKAALNKLAGTKAPPAVVKKGKKS